MLRERGLLIVKSTLDICTSSGQCCSRRSFSSSPSQSCDSRQQQLVAATPQLRAAMSISQTCTKVFLRKFRQHSCWSQWQDDGRSFYSILHGSLHIHGIPSPCPSNFSYGCTGFSSYGFSATVPAAVVLAWHFLARRPGCPSSTSSCSSAPEASTCPAATADVPTCPTRPSLAQARWVRGVTAGRHNAGKYDG